METIKVKITKEQNWALNEYLIYSTEKHGKLAEVDYPIEGDPFRKKPRVYPLSDSVKEKLDVDFVNFSSIPSACAGAEALVTGYLLDNGYHAVYDYPRTIKTR